MRGRQPSPSPAVKGDPPLTLLAERPRTLQQGPSAPEQPLLPQPAQREPGLPGPSGTKAGLWDAEQGVRACGSWRSPCCDSLGRQNWRESSGADREMGRCCCPPAAGDVPAHINLCDSSTGDRSREGGQITGTLQTLLLLLLCPWHIPGQGPALPAILAKGQSHCSSASNETAAEQAQS